MVANAAADKSGSAAVQGTRPSMEEPSLGDEKWAAEAKREESEEVKRLK